MTATRWRQAYDDWTLWLGLNGFEVERRFRGLSGTRRWRFDWLHQRYPIAVEYMGLGRGKDQEEGRGAHETRSGLARDYAKTTEAQLCGYTVIQCSAETVEDGRCTRWIEAAIQLRANP